MVKYRRKNIDESYDDETAVFEMHKLNSFVEYLGSSVRLDRLTMTSDCEYIIKLQAMLDELVSGVLLAHFCKVSPLEQSRLKDIIKGPFQTSEAKHELAGALHLIGAETCDGLRAIRKVRNPASHEQDFDVITVDHVNALRGACPTFAKNAKNSRCSVSATFGSIAGCRLSKERLAHMDISMLILTLLLSSKVALEHGSDYEKC